MPERGFSTDYWADTFVESLTSEGKLLYAYLWTNPHCNQAGLYEISLDRIAYETRLPVDSLSSLMKSLEPKVKWYPEQNLVWVKNFIKRQAKSPKFLVAAAKSLSAIHNNGAVTELLEYNLKRYTISIPYGYSMDSVGIPSDLICSISSAKSSSNAGKERGIVKGEREIETVEAIPPSESEYGESLSEGDREVIATWCSVRGFKLAPSDASELVARLRKEFADVDILQESKKWAARKLSEPLTNKSRPSSQIWNWMCNERKYAEERRTRGEKGQRVKGARPASDFTGRW